MINKHAYEIIDSIIEDFALCGSSLEEMEALWQAAKGLERTPDPSAEGAVS